MSKLIRLVEKTEVVVKKEDIEIFDKNILTESIEGEQVSCRGILKNVPVSKYTENDNNRIYNRSLWEKVKESNKAEGSLSLMDHPEDEGSVKDICGIWKNMRLGEDFVYADWYLVGDNGQLLIEVVNAGGKIGISSVGYGEFLEDGKTVNPDTYELERLGDCVINPSQNVYATKNNVVSVNKEEKEEKKVNKITEILKKDEILNESFTNKIIEENEIKEKIYNNQQEVEIMERIHEANFKNHVFALIKEAKKNENLTEGIESLKRIDTAGNEYLTEKVEEAIFELQNKLEEQKNKAEKNLAEVSSELTEIKAKYEIACQSLEQMKENYLKAKAIIEKAGLKENQEIDNILVENATIKKHLKILKENKKKLNNNIQQLIEDRRNMYNDIKALLEDRKNMLSDIKQLIEDRKNMKSDIKILLEKYFSLKKIYAKMIKKIKEEEEEKENDVYKFSFDSEQKTEEDEKPVLEDSEEISNVNLPKENEEVVLPEEDEEVVLPEEDEEVMLPEEDEEVMLPEEDEEVMLPEEDEEVVLPEEDEIEKPISEEDEKISGENGKYGYMGGEGKEIEEDEEVVLPKENEEKPISEEDEEKPISEEDEEEIKILADDEEDQNSIEQLKDEDEEIVLPSEKKPETTNTVVEKRKIIQSEINKLYIAEAKKYPALKNISKFIINSNSVVEALNRINKFKESRKIKNSTPVKITESIAQRPEWLRDRK